MHEKEILETASRAIEVAKGLMIRDGYLAPSLFIYGTNNVVTPMCLKIESVQDKEDISELMKKIAHSGGADALLLMVDAYVLVTDVTDLPVNLKGSLKDNPNSKEAIVAYLHTKTETFLRHIPYMKEDGRYTFMDMPWEKQLLYKSRFENPWLIKK